MRNSTEPHDSSHAAEAAFQTGDMAALRAALGDPPDFPNCRMAESLGMTDYPLEYAIYWSPYGFIAELVALGADVDRDDPAGFPSLMATLSTGRPDRLDILRLLLDNGADMAQRGFNDWTPLHHAVALRDLAAVELLLDYGADPNVPTRIDDRTSPLEDAEQTDFTDAVRSMRR